MLRVHKFIGSLLDLRCATCSKMRSDPVHAFKPSPDVETFKAASGMLDAAPVPTQGRMIYDPLKGAFVKCR